MLIRVSAAALFLVSAISAFGQGRYMGEGKFAFTAPNAPWSLTLVSMGGTLTDQKTNRDGSGTYFLISNKRTNLTVSLWIEPAAKCKTSRACRDMILKAGNPMWGEFQDLVQSEIGEVSYFQFYRPTIEGQPVKMLDMYAEFVKDGYWVDIHMSKVLYKAEDHALFEDVIKSVIFEPKQ